MRDMYVEYPRLLNTRNCIFYRESHVIGQRFISSDWWPARISIFVEILCNIETKPVNAMHQLLIMSVVKVLAVKL